MRRKKQFPGSYTHVFAMVYPWVSLLTVALLHEAGVIDVLKVSELVVFGIAIIPVVVAVALFFLKKPDPPTS